MTDLKSKTLPELTDFLKSMGQPAFRGKQVFTWLHRGVRSFEEMTNLPKALRDQLAENCVITAPTAVSYTHLDVYKRQDHRRGKMSDRTKAADPPRC